MTISWKGLFSSVIKSRGQNYYYQNRVRLLEEDITVDSDGYYDIPAVVVGTDKYSVNISVNSSGEVGDMSCTCAYAANGAHCKHMAAALFKIQRWIPSAELRREAEAGAKERAARRKIEEEIRRKKEEEEKRRAEELFFSSRKRVYPFKPQGNSEEYQYFDLDKLTKDYVIFDKELAEARELISNGYRVSCTIVYPNNNEGGPQINVGSYYYESIRISHSELNILRCDNYRCRGYNDGYFSTPAGKKALCAHSVANLLQVQSFLKNRTDHVDATNQLGLKLFDSFQKRLPKSEKDGSGSRVLHLEPSLVRNDSDDMKMSFRIGAEKMYNLKSLTDLVDKVESRGELALTKLGVFRFDKDTFDEQSQKYYEMIKAAVAENRDAAERSKRGSWYSSPTVPQLRTEMPIFGARIDRLYDIIGEGSLYFLDMSTPKGVSSELKTKEMDPTFRLKINQIIDEDGTFHGVSLNGSVPELIPGGRYDYCLEESSKGSWLCRLSPEGADRLKPFRDLTVGNRVELNIGRSHLAEFFYNVLPEIRKLAEIDEPDYGEILNYLPPQAEFTIYLDAEDKRPVGRVTVTYGEEVCSLLDLRRENVQMKDFRQISAEKRTFDLMARYFGFMNLDKDQFICAESEEAILRLMDQGLQEMTDFCEVKSTPAFDKLRFRSFPQVSIGVSLSDGNLLDLTIDFDEISREELLEILESYKLKKNYHRLRSGGWVKMDENVAELNAIMETLRINPKDFVAGNMHIPAYRALYLDAMLARSEGLYATRDQRFRKLIKEFKTVDDSDFEVPEGLEKILRSYQTHGYKWLRTLGEHGFGGILADEMGLGKTLQMIAVLQADKDAGVGGQSLIVCPASLVYNWQEEFRRFAPGMTTAVIAGTKSEREALLAENAGGADVLITSYDLLKRDIHLYEDKQFNFQVIDEAQFVKTHNTAAAKSVRLVHAGRRFALTGTPIENRLSELWSIFDYLMPGFLYNYETFKRQLETPIVKQQNQEAQERLKKMVSPFILRRLKGDVLKDLPDKLEEVRYVRFEGEQKKLYDAQVVKIRSMLEKSSDEDINKSKIKILAELTRIRQICCDPSLLFENFKDESAKRLACLELVQSAIEGGHRILLFSQFTSMLSLLEKDLTDAGIEWYTITGSTPKQERVDLVRRFNEGDTPVFLISLKAGGTGLNLTGADTVIHYDPWWNVAAQNQATDRAHRIGQTRTVSVYKLIGKDSIEEKILKLQKDKQDLADEILSGETRSLSSFSKEELMELLG